VAKQKYIYVLGSVIDKGRSVVIAAAPTMEKAIAYLGVVKVEKGPAATEKYAVLFMAGTAEPAYDVRRVPFYK